MKDMNDISKVLREQLDRWYKGMTANNYEEYYLIYRETTHGDNGHCKEPGEIEISAEKSIPPNFKLGSSRIHGGATKEQWFNHLYQICRTLPILEY